jgi:hypothetical protein
MRFQAMSKVDLQKHLLAIALLANLAPYRAANAQQPLHFPSPELAIPGVAVRGGAGRCIRSTRNRGVRQ